MATYKVTREQVETYGRLMAEAYHMGLDQSKPLREALEDAAEFLRNGTPIHPGSDVATRILEALRKS